MIKKEQVFIGPHMGLDHIPWPAVVYAAATGKIENVNEQAAALYGYEIPEFQKMLRSDLFGEVGATTTNAAGGYLQEFTGEHVHSNKHGVPMKLSTRSKLVRHEGTEYYFAIILDAQLAVAEGGHEQGNSCGSCTYNVACAQTLLDMDSVATAQRCVHYNEMAVHKENESKLQERVRETEDIIESVAEAFFAADRNWILTYVNRAAEELYNIRREESLNRSVWDVFPKVPGSIFHEQYLRAVRDNIPVSIEGLSPSSGRWVRSYAYPTKNGIAVFFKDITEQKRLSEQLKHHLGNLNSLINNTEDIIWSVDLDHYITTINRSCRNLLMRLCNVSLNVGDYSLPAELGEERINVRKANYEKALTSGSFKVVHELKIGNSNKFYETSYNPIINADGAKVGVSCFARDITDARKLLRKTMNQNKTLQEIAWMQSHKIRGPLSTILGLLQLYEHGETTDDALWFIIEGINEKAQQLDELVRTITQMTYDAENEGDNK